VLDVLTDFILKCAAYRSKRRRNSSNETSSESGSDTEDIQTFAAQSCKLKDVEAHHLYHVAGGTGQHPAVVDVLSIAAGGSRCTDEIIVDVGLQDAAAAMKMSDELQLVRTSLLIALALGFHNLPEGLATFVGCVPCPELCAVLQRVHVRNRKPTAAAHTCNLPEGLAVFVECVLGHCCSVECLDGSADSDVPAQLQLTDCMR
jgi:zinc transporter ZupT